MAYASSEYVCSNEEYFEGPWKCSEKNRNGETIGFGIKGWEWDLGTIPLSPIPGTASGSEVNGEGKGLLGKRRCQTVNLS